MPGIINTQIGGPATTPTPDDKTKVSTIDSTAGYDAAQRTVDPNQTVSGQLTQILDKGSPLMDQARTGAMETANSRGLVNSSIAAGAGESAAIGAALPIAQQDASTFGQAAAQNTEAQNTASQFTAGAENTAKSQNAGAVNTSTQTQLSGEIQTGLQQLRGTQATDLANIEANYKTLMQANSSAASIFNEAQQQIATILRDPNTSQEQKASAVDGVTQLLKSSLAVTGSIANLDLSKLLDFTSPVTDTTTGTSKDQTGNTVTTPAGGDQGNASGPGGDAGGGPT